MIQKAKAGVVDVFGGGGLCGVCGRAAILTGLDVETGIKVGSCCKRELRKANAVIKDQNASSRDMGQ